MQYWQLDVFAERPLAGNGLAVFDDACGLSSAAMQSLTQELRQFESIFLQPGATADTFSARIFTLEEELPFAGHPVIGAAALLHHLHNPAEHADWHLHLTAKTVQISTQRLPRGFYAEMNQGLAEFGVQLSQAQAAEFASAFGLDHSEQDLRYPATVVSTGLPYVLLARHWCWPGQSQTAAGAGPGVADLRRRVCVPAGYRRPRGPHLGPPRE